MEPRDLLDPDVAAGVAHMPDVALAPAMLGAIRSFSLEVPLSDAVTRTDHLVPGEPEVPVRVHRARGAEGPFPCLFSIHGGGYVVGSYTMDDPLFDTLCPKLGLVGVSVEYRLAPDTPYPGPLEDCYRALRWTYEHAEALGIDAARLGIGGASAGGGLAARAGWPGRSAPDDDRLGQPKERPWSKV